MRFEAGPSRLAIVMLAVCCGSLAPGVARAQAPWHFMQDGIVFVEFNHQGGPRGGDEAVAPNWWMGMGTRSLGPGQLTLVGMLSLDPVTVGQAGYRELFQSGEAHDNRLIVDRQHPHDFFMQLAAVWRTRLRGGSTGLTLAAAPAGEPSLGPVAFMHRASALDNPTAPLGHHTFDSTHVSFGVITAAVDRGPLTVEGSIFNGREPDDNRWDFDFGRLDSWSGRVWFRPNPRWEFQASTGRLKAPEELEPGDVTRTTASASWTRAGGANVTAVTAGIGRNATDRGTRGALFVEAARRRGYSTAYTRFEALQVDPALLQSGEDTGTFRRDALFTFTAGGVRDVIHAGRFEGGFGADVTFYAVPSALDAAYSSHPVSFHLFFRVRPRAGSMGPMWNMRMSQPMGGD